MNERVAELRTAIGLSQEKFGEILGITKSSISQIEKGKTTLSKKNISLLCERLNVNYEWLVNGIGEMFSNDDTLEAQINRKMLSMNDSQRDIMKMLINAPDEIWEQASNIIDWLQSADFKH